MSRVTAKIKSLYKSLPKSEKKVADFILKNAGDVPFYSVYDVAGRVEVSVASVSRFVRGVGYTSFQDFKVELARGMPPEVPEIFNAITADDSDGEVVRKVFMANRQSIEDTLKILSVPDLIRVSKELSKTKRLVFFGIGSSGNVAKEAALRFCHLDVQAEACTDPVYMVVSAKRLKKGEAAVVISHSGRSLITVEALRVASENSAVTVGITNYMKSPIGENSRYLLCTSFYESSVKAAALSSRIAQLCLLDALYLLTARHKETLWDIADLNNMTEKLLRHGDRG
jgi:DNA-binding MurR/RpiR family transcriptional regulator